MTYKKLGLIGGLGPEATVDYYKELIGLCNKNNPDGSLYYPEIIIYSVNMSKLINAMSQGDYETAAGYLVDCIRQLEKNEVDVVAITANTPHLLFDEIQLAVDVPLISIVKSCRERAESLQLKRCGLLGTKFTMNADFYHCAFAQEGLDVFSPDEHQIEIINSKLFEEIELGIFRDETRKEILSIVEEMIKRWEIDSVILGCTEFPLLFREEKYFGIPFLNTTRIHVEAIYKEITQQ